MDYQMTNSEQISFKLRSLYEKYGYKFFKLKKFEEYDFYSTYKDFLTSGKILTFNDTNGKLMALKPDVTMSVVKKTIGINTLEKIYYSENVYRTSPSIHGFTEITQTGVECIGDLDLYSEAEVVALAAKSLQEINDNYLLDISNVDIVLGFANYITKGKNVDVFLKYISEKNIPAVRQICVENGIAEEKIAALCDLISFYGDLKTGLEKIKNIIIDSETEKAFINFSNLVKTLETYSIFDKLRLDISIEYNKEYYNGIVFNGYIKEIPEKVLSGGRYDKLANKLGKEGKAIGFAIYHNLLEKLYKTSEDSVIDVLILYNDKNSARKVIAEVENIIAQGLSVKAVKDTSGYKYNQLLDIRLDLAYLD